MNEHIQGVTPSGPGSQASPEAARASSPSVSIPNAGEYVIYDDGYAGRSRYRVRRVVKVTPKLVKFVGEWPRQINRSQVVLALAKEDVAKLLCQGLDGIAGEYQRRRKAAQDDFNTRVQAAREAQERQLEDFLRAAQAIEDESAVAESDAP